MKVDFKKAVAVALLILFGLNLGIDAGLIPSHDDDNYASSLASYSDISAAKEIANNKEPVPRECNDPCHLGECHFGHCGHIIVSNYPMISKDLFRNFRSGFLKTPADPHISGLKRPPRFS